MWFLHYWLVAVILLQWAFFVATAFMADCRGAGLAESPSLLLYLASATALTAALTESQLVKSCCSIKRLATLAFTAFNFFDSFTDSLSAGSVVASHFCEESKMDEAWLQVVEQSLLPVSIPLWVVACGAWAAGGLQIALVIYMAGISDRREQKATVADLLGFETLATAVIDKGVLLDDPTDDGDAVAGEAELLDEPTNDADRAVGESKELSDDQKSSMMFKFALRLVAENLLQMHVQLTTVGLSLALAGWSSATLKVLLSAAMSATFLTVKFVQTVPAVRGMWAEPGYPVEAKCIFIAFPVSLTVVLGVYGIGKFMALFVCPDSLLNMSGCAEVNMP